MGPRLAAAALVASVLSAAGCATTPSGRPQARIPADVRTELAYYRGEDGQRVDWFDLTEGIADADIIIVGEEHDDAVGHRVELAIVEEVLAAWPDSALSMEMLDRRKQAAVDDYFAEFIDVDEFYERVASTRWRKITREYLDGSINRKTFARRMSRLGWPDWQGNYQPMIDVAKEAGACVVAANTPWLLYTSVARKDGFERLEQVTPAQRALFEVPAEVPEGRYRERFWEAIAGRAEGEAPPEADDAEGGGPHHALTDEQVLGMFRGQLVMDATMAGSIADASQAGADKVVHLVGHFHCDFDGGLVQELRRRLPDARILVISLLNVDEAALRDEDLGRADFVVYTGYRESS
jgi:uncharacterized iron-regulated protein